VHFASNRGWEHLRQLVSIGPRPSGSAALEQTRKYIKDQLAAVGHHDTKRLLRFRFVGANDGGSSAAFLIELARAHAAHTAGNTLDAVSARSLQVVGDVVVAALPQLEAQPVARRHQSTTTSRALHQQPVTPVALEPRTGPGTNQSSRTSSK
jgi:peptidase M28-like protein